MNIGVIGAGTMGSGIAQAFAQTDGFDVRLCDLNIELAQRGLDQIEKRLEKRVLHGKLSRGGADAVLARITVCERDAVSGCELIVEAALEDAAVKRRTFSELDALCAPECIFATNTSSLSVTGIGEGLSHPVIGMHFFNPAPVMPLVEVVVGLNVPEAAVSTVERIVRDIGKTPVRVQDSPGFVVNRLLVPMLNEAAGIYADGVASAADIDRAMQLGANHPMGPLALADLIGIDVVLAIMESLQRETGDPKYRPHPLLKKMVRGGLLGVKSGGGFFDYHND